MTTLRLPPGASESLGQCKSIAKYAQPQLLGDGVGGGSGGQ